MSQETLLLSIIIDDVTCQFDNEEYFREKKSCFISECYKQIPMYGVTGLSSVSVYKTRKRITLPQILLKLNLAKIKSI